MTSAELLEPSPRTIWLAEPFKLEPTFKTPLVTWKSRGWFLSLSLVWLRVMESASNTPLEPIFKVSAASVEYRVMLSAVKVPPSPVVKVILSVAAVPDCKAVTWMPLILASRS